jgi:hypothetical protein
MEPLKTLMLGSLLHLVMPFASTVNFCHCPSNLLATFNLQALAVFSNTVKMKLDKNNLVSMLTANTLVMDLAINMPHHAVTLAACQDQHITAVLSMN